MIIIIIIIFVYSPFDNTTSCPRVFSSTPYRQHYNNNITPIHVQSVVLGATNAIGQKDSRATADR